MSYAPRDLRIVNNNTPGYYGGFSVETTDTVVAGPYAARDDAKQAKRDLVAGRPVQAAG